MVVPLPGKIKAAKEWCFHSSMRKPIPHPILFGLVAREWSRPGGLGQAPDLS
jgi:hypothetical protein